MWDLHSLNYAPFSFLPSILFFFLCGTENLFAQFSFWVDSLSWVYDYLHLNKASVKSVSVCSVFYTLALCHENSTAEVEASTPYSGNLGKCSRNGGRLLRAPGIFYESIRCVHSKWTCWKSLHLHSTDVPKSNWHGYNNSNFNNILGIENVQNLKLAPIFKLDFKDYFKSRILIYNLGQSC